MTQNRPTPPREGSQDRLERLTALRDDLRGHLDDCPAYAAAPLAREYRAVLAEIDTLSPPKGVTNPIDELLADVDAWAAAGGDGADAGVDEDGFADR